MNCQQVRELASEYCDGDSNARQKVAIEAHLEACEACRTEVEAMRALIHEAASLDSGLAPSRDLWPEIEGRLTRRPASVVRGPWRALPRFGLAAAAALVVAAVLLVARHPEPRATAEVTVIETIERASPEVRSGVALASERARVEAGLLHVREDLLRAIAARRDDLDPRTVDLVGQNLQIIDQAIGEIYQALEQDPDNRRLESLLAANYQREAELLKQINLL